MTHTQTITPKKRINSIDALRGFALIGIMLLHCMERFDLTLAPVVESPFWQAIDTIHSIFCFPGNHTLCFPFCSV